MRPALSRRRFLQGSTTALVACFSRRINAQTAPGAHMSTIQPGSVKALVFDVFGTVVDWRSSIAAEVQQLAARKGFTIDAPKFADAWRAGYAPAMNRVRSGELPWTKLDRLHRMILDRV